MAADNSFDVISKVDVQEVKNAMDQAIKEVRTRFDLKDSHSEIKLLEGDDAEENIRRGPGRGDRFPTFVAAPVRQLVAAVVMSRVFQLPSTLPAQ